MKTLILIFTSCISLTILSQKQVKIVPFFAGKKLELHRAYLYSDSNNYLFSTLKFYLSNIRVNNAKGELEIKGIHLYDLEDTLSFELFRTSEDIKSIVFLLGTDSTTNVLGIFEGPLDPLLGMYWAWNSGYINFKLEGKSSRSSQSDHSFEYHIGGYLPPFTTSRSVSLDVTRPTKSINIEFHLDEWLNAVDLSTKPSIMIPGMEASSLADRLVPVFKIGYEE